MVDLRRDDSHQQQRVYPDYRTHLHPGGAPRAGLADRQTGHPGGTSPGSPPSRRLRGGGEGLGVGMPTVVESQV
jgi:hypothetical protein